jgi:hypothetical protein
MEKEQSTWSGKGGAERGDIPRRMIPTGRVWLLVVKSQYEQINNDKSLDHTAHGGHYKELFF